MGEWSLDGTRAFEELEESMCAVADGEPLTDEKLHTILAAHQVRPTVVWTRRDPFCMFSRL
jgi:hypothetical protein